jgi:hypothetical protein
VEDNIQAKNTDISMLEGEISQMKFEKEKVLSEMNALNQVSISAIYCEFNFKSDSFISVARTSSLRFWQQ